MMVNAPLRSYSSAADPTKLLPLCPPSAMATVTSGVFLCFILLHNTTSVHGSLKCCFQVLKNHSVAFELSESPRSSCITTWSHEDVVVVDENGDVDHAVVYCNSQKLILSTAEEVTQVTYRLDCHSSGISQTVKCESACAAEEEVPDSKAIIAVIISIATLIIVIAIAIAITCKKRLCSASNSIVRAVWNAVPNDPTSQV